MVENNKLLHYRALDAEKQKWEARAARLTVQLDKSTECFRVLQDMGKSSGHSVSEKSALLKDYDSICSPAISEISTNTSYKPSCSKRETCVEAETDNENVYITTSTPFTNSPAAGHTSSVPTFTAPLLNQLPPIARFSGEEQPDGEMFQDWLEQFESVAQLAGWNDHAKLVNLTIVR